MTKNSSFVSWSLKQSRELSVKVWLLTFLTDAKFSTTSLQGFAVSDLYIYFSAQRVSASRWRPGYATGRRGLAPGGALHQFCTTPALAVRSTANTIAGMKLVVEAAKSRERRRGGPRPVYQAAGVSLAPRHQKGPDEHNKRTFNEDKLALVAWRDGTSGPFWPHWENCKIKSCRYDFIRSPFLQAVNMTLQGGRGRQGPEGKPGIKGEKVTLILCSYLTLMYLFCTLYCQFPIISICMLRSLHRWSTKISVVLLCKCDAVWRSGCLIIR